MFGVTSVCSNVWIPPSTAMGCNTFRASATRESVTSIVLVSSPVLVKLKSDFFRLVLSAFRYKGFRRVNGATDSACSACNNCFFVGFFLEHQVNTL